MKIFDEKTLIQLKEAFDNKLKNEVKILFFKSSETDKYIEETEAFLNELKSTTDKIKLEIYENEENNEKIEKFSIKLYPAIVLTNEDESITGIKYYGIPAGHEINSFVLDLISISGNEKALSAQILDRINKINKKVNIKIFISLSCPHCPGAVVNAHRLALENRNIDAEMIESSRFNELANKFGVSAVPHILFNETEKLLGDQPLDKFLDIIENL
ncbi:protein disulfide oxidoreductase [Haliovirga abyssi]|uniref:Glutaredoxin n=1 Tax=Haliovirga abyssi TaxID=2996794 RepID=A0AAU9D6A6_9FUSO|nr:thioredoxin family protein [Haliovirga abyssi]BDU51514.1 glutaredoxin [Haliovirga abyssi]